MAFQKFQQTYALKALKALRGLLHLTIICSIFHYRQLLTAGYPLLAEGILQILLSEINRRKQKQRLLEADGGEQDDLEVLKPKFIRPTPCVGSVVGYREDPVVFRKCLESYLHASSEAMKALIIGIDGNDSEDLEMVRVAESVFGKKLAKIEIKEPLGDLAMTITEQYAQVKHRDMGEKSSNNKFPALDKDGIQEHVLDVLITRASEILRQNSVLYVNEGGLQPVCIYQTHRCKKDILFTSFIFTLALARANNIEFIWSSDSDSWICPGTIRNAVGGMVSDESIAGSCTSIIIHNHDASLVAKLAASTYATDLALMSGILSAFDSTDCQSGPCALFRRDALREILMPWYFQTFWGIRPVVNEDRHFTTRLLMGGWKVTFNPLATVATDTPTTFSTLTAQQTRWARATAIEMLAHPGMFLSHSPILFLYTIRRIVVPITNLYLVVAYVFANQRSLLSGGTDILLRIFLTSLYSSFRTKWSISGVFFQSFSQLFFQVPQVAYLFWAFVTAFETNWGTSMRSQVEKARGRSRSALMKNIGQSITVASWIGLVIAATCKSIASRLLLEDEIFPTVVGFFIGFFMVLYIYAKDI